MNMLTRIGVFAFAVGPFALLNGCGPGRVESKPLSVATIPGPHGGTAIPIEGGIGYCEARLEQVGKVGRNEPRESELAVYFLGSDGKTSLTTLPSEVSASLMASVNSSDRHSKTMPLVSKPKSADSAGAARFATEPGRYAEDSIRGRLNVVIDGKSIKIPLNVH